MNPDNEELAHRGDGNSCPPEGINASDAPIDAPIRHRPRRAGDRADDAEPSHLIDVLPGKTKHSPSLVAAQIFPS